MKKAFKYVIGFIRGFLGANLLLTAACLALVACFLVDGRRNTLNGMERMWLQAHNRAE